jgi:hypothetical protein
MQESLLVTELVLDLPWTVCLVPCLGHIEFRYVCIDRSELFLPLSLNRPDCFDFVQQFPVFLHCPGDLSVLQFFHVFHSLGNLVQQFFPFYSWSSCEIPPLKRSSVLSAKFRQFISSVTRTGPIDVVFAPRRIVSLLPCPAKSLDLSPIEQVWALVKQHLRGRRYSSADSLYKVIGEEFIAIPDNVMH